MGTWWTIFLCDMVIPAIMLISGWWMQKHPPKKPSAWCGYRTRRSRQSAEAWAFAQSFCGAQFTKLGLRLLIICALVHIPFYREADSTLGIVCIVLVCAQTAAVLLAAARTEMALKKNFG